MKKGGLQLSDDILQFVLVLNMPEGIFHHFEFVNITDEFQLLDHVAALISKTEFDAQLNAFPKSFLHSLDKTFMSALVCHLNQKIIPLGQSRINPFHKYDSPMVNKVTLSKWIKKLSFGICQNVTVRSLENHSGIVNKKLNKIQLNDGIQIILNHYWEESEILFMGIVTEKHEPFPGRLSTRMPPLCRSTSCRVI